jgi:hypothetical protein
VDAAGIGAGHDGVAAAVDLGDTCRLRDMRAATSLDLVTGTRHTVVAGSCCPLD